MNANIIWTDGTTIVALFVSSRVRVARSRKRIDSSFCGKRHLPRWSFTFIFWHAAVSTGLGICVIVGTIHE
jgi:hypothetical protein